MDKLTIIKVNQDNKGVTNGKFHVICQTQDGKTVEGYGNSIESAKADAQTKVKDDG